MKTKSIKKNKNLKLSLTSNIASMNKFNTHFNNHLSGFYSEIVKRGIVLLGAVIALAILII